MNDINFTGGFLLPKPNPKVWENVYNNIVPRNRVVIHDLYEKGNVFFATQTCYDSDILKYLIDKKVDFRFYPNINLRARLDAYYPKQAATILDSEIEVFSPADNLKKYFKPYTLTRYRWRENDHIVQINKALDLRKQNYKMITENSVTTIYDPQGKVVGKASPNNNKGSNFVLLYPRFTDEDIRLIQISYRGFIEKESHDITDLAEFKKDFLHAVKIDRGRKKPTT